MKTDSALAAVRRVREAISREFANDPARLIAHYMERQAHHAGQILHGPEGEIDRESLPQNPAQQAVPRPKGTSEGG